jgi:hypothetical protein
MGNAALSPVSSVIVSAQVNAMIVHPARRCRLPMLVGLSRMLDRAGAGQR